MENYKPNLFPRLNKIAEAGRVILHFVTQRHHIEHVNTGAAPMLDRELHPGEIGAVLAFPSRDSEPELPFPPAA